MSFVLVVHMNMCVCAMKCCAGNDAAYDVCGWGVGGCGAYLGFDCALRELLGCCCTLLP